MRQTPLNQTPLNQTPLNQTLMNLTLMLLVSFLIITFTMTPVQAADPAEKADGTPNCHFWDLPCWLDKIWPDEEDLTEMEKKLDDLSEQGQEKLEEFKDEFDKQTEELKRKFDKDREPPLQDEDQITDI